MRFAAFLPSPSLLKFRHRGGQTLANFVPPFPCGCVQCIEGGSNTCSPRHQAPQWLPERTVNSAPNLFFVRVEEDTPVVFNLAVDMPLCGWIVCYLISGPAALSEIAGAFRYRSTAWVSGLAALEGCCRVPRHLWHCEALETPCDLELAFRNSDGCSKDIHVKHCDMTASHGLTQFSSDGIPHFCILFNAKSSLKKLVLAFPYLDLYLLAVVHFVTWDYVSWLMGSPNLAGRQPNNLKSFIHIGERELYSVLEKLPVAADWIVYHTLVPLFLDLGWASVQTGGE